MEITPTLIGALIGLVSGLVTAYVTMRFRLAEERAKWKRDLALAYSAARTESPVKAQALAQDFGVGVLIVRVPGQERAKYFIPPDARLVVGRDEGAQIRIDEPMASRQHMSFDAKGSVVFATDFSANGIVVDGAYIRNESRRLKTGDAVHIGQTEIIYVDL